MNRFLLLNILKRFRGNLVSFCCMLFFFCCTFTAYAQTFTKHYIAPAPWQYFNDANEVVITTNTPGTTVTIKKSDGTPVATITVDPATPGTYRFTAPLGATNGSNYNALNTILTDRGMIIEGDNPITVNVRNLYTAADFSRMVGVASLFSFGDGAIGTSFRVGYYRDGDLNGQSFSRRPVYSVMAIENNTTVRVNGTTLVTLKAGESYLFNANMGSLVETSASAVVNTGTLMDTPNICGDAAFNSVPPVASLGSEYLTLRSAGNNTAEQTTIIATEPNTSVVVTNYNTDGTVFSANTYALVSGGSFVTVNTGIPGSCTNFSSQCGVQYSASKISATKNVVAFSGVAYGCEADVLTLVPLASCGGSLVAKTFKFRDLSGSSLVDIDYFGYITIKSPTEKVYLTTTGPTPFTNVDIETISGVGVRRQIGSTGIYLIDFTRANIGTPDAITLTSGIGINAAMIGPSPGVAMANYFTPLPEQAKRPILVPQPDCTTAQLSADPSSVGPFQWYKDSYPIAGATNSTYTPTVSGAYSITSKLGCGISTQSVPVSVYLCNIDRGITKTVDNPNPPINGTVRFTITASNSGTGEAIGVYATDLLKDGFSFLSYTSTAGTSYDKTTGTWSIGDMAAGSTATLVITAKVLATGDHNNIANISGTQTDPNPANDSASQSVTPVSTLSLTSADGTDAQTVCYNSSGTTITYKAPLGSVTVTGLPATYGFTIAADASDPLAQIITIRRTNVLSNTLAGFYTYTVKIATAAGDVITTGTIKVDGANALPVFDLGPTSTRCQGFGTQIYKATSANTRGITYAIVTNPASSGNNIYAVINPNTGEVTWSPNFVGTATITATSSGCFGNRRTDHVVTVTTSGTVTGTSPVCSGDNGQLTRTGTATFKRWEYSIDGGTNWNVFTGTFTSTTLDYTNIQATTDFRAIVDVGSCVNIPSSPFTVDVIQRPVIANQTFNYCGGAGSFAFQPVDVPAGTTYSWPDPIVTGGSVTGATASATPQTSVTQNLTNTGNSMATVTYTVTATNGICVGTPFTITVAIGPSSIIASTTNPATVCSGGSFMVTPSSSLTNLKYTWTASVLSGTNISGFSDQSTPQSAPISQALVNNSTTVGVVRYTVTPVLDHCSGTPFSFDVTIDAPPVTSDVTHPTAISNQSTSTTISALVGTDEGSVVSYTINTLPNSGAGILTLADGTPVTAGQVVTPAQAAALKFKPQVGYVGQATFTYVATDNGGCSDLTPATYTINVVRPDTDLAISKTANPKPAVAGQSLTYTITLTNNGPGALLSNETVTVTDNLPVGFTATTYAASSGTYNQSTGDWTGLSLATGQSATITIQGNVAPSASGTLNNTANLTLPATIADPIPANNTATDATPVSEKPVLVVVKTGQLGVTAGTQVQYSIKVSNTGPSNAVGAIIADAVPASITNVEWTAIPSGAAAVTSGGTGTGNSVSLVGNIPTGSANFITLTVTGTLNSSATGSLSNTATATPSASQPDGTSGSSTFISTINSTTGITLTKSAPPTAISGSVISYQLEIGNNGPSDAPIVNVADAISAQLTNVSWSATRSGLANINSGSTGNGNNLALVGNIPAGAANKIIINISGTINPSFSGNLTNTASATPQGGTAVNASTSTTVASLPAFSFSKSGPTTANAGQTIQYVLTAKNTGTSNSTASVISDVVPNTLTNVSWTASVASGTATITAGTSGTGNNVSVTANTQPNATIEVVVTGTIPSGFSGSLDNSASITPSESGTTPTTSTVTTTVKRVPTLAIQKLGPATIAAGQAITYTIRVTNTGTADAIASVITDAIPAAILNPSWTTAKEGLAEITAGVGGTGATLNVTGNIPAGSGNAILVTITGTVDPAQSADIVNTATVTPAELSSAPVSSSVTTTVTKQPSIVINKTGPASVFAGETVTYQIDVTNNGPSNTTALPITDVVPAILTNVSWTATASGSSVVNGVASGNTNNVAVNADVKVGAANKISILVTGTVPSSQTATSINNQASATPVETNVAVSSNQVATTIGIKNGLELTKSAPTSISAGQQITYTILAENNGPSNATNAVITDPIPTGISNVTWTTAVNGSASVNAGTLTGNNLSFTASIPSGNSVLITIQGTVDATFTGSSLSNTATATPSESGNPPVNSNTTVTPVGKTSDLRIVKTGPQTAVAGQTITYNLVVTNGGPSVANNVSIADNIPAGLNNVSWSATAEGAAAVVGASSGSGIPTLLADIGTATTDKINVVVTGTLAADYVSADITNTASATPESGVSDPTPAMASVTSTVSRVADVRITKSAPANAGPGETITYTLDVTNNGLTTATGTRIVDNMPAEITSSSWTVTNSGGATTSVPSGTGNVDLMADIPKGGNVQVIITATINPSATVGSTVTNRATATEGSSITDSDLTNNEASADTKLVANGSYRISKTGPNTASVGETIRYDVLVQNTGLSPLTGVQIADMVPPGLTDVTWTATAVNGTITLGSVGSVNNVSITGDLGPESVLGANDGGKINVVILATVSPAALSSTVNTATVNVNPSQVPADVPSKSSDKTTSVIHSADISVVKSGPASVAAGDVLTYTIVAQNFGPADANNIRIIDNLPATISSANWIATFEGATLASGLDSGTGNIDLFVNLPAGVANKVTIVVTANIPSNTVPQTIINTASYNLNGAPVTDFNESNNSSSVTTEIVSDPQLVVQKSGPSTASAGDVINYVVRVGNTGLSDATGVNITDVVPSTITGVSWTSTLGAGASLTSGDTGNNVNTLSASGNIPSGSYVEFHVRGTIDPNYTGSITNTAEAAVGTGIPVQSTPVVTTVSKDAILSIVKNAPATLNSGGTLTYTIQVNNAGPSNLVNTAISDNVSNSLSNVTWSAVASGGALINAGAAGTGNTVGLITNMPAGSQILLTISGKTASNFSGDILNTATVTPSEPGLSAVQSNQTTTTVSRKPNLTFQKTAPSNVNAGERLAFALVLENNGLSDAIGTQLEDNIPSTLTDVQWTSVSTGGASVTAGASGTVNTLAATADVPVGGKVVFNISGLVASTETGTIINNATATPIESGTTPITASTSTTVVQKVDMVVTKSAPANAKAGESITYVVTVKNNGPSTATGLSITDIKPAGLQSWTWTATASNNASILTGGNTGTGDINLTANLGAADSDEIRIVVTGIISSSYSGSISNTATATPTLGTGAAVSSVVNTTVTRTPNLVITKTGPTAVINGGVINYQIVVANNSPSDALNAAITDVVNSNLTNVSWTATAQGSANVLIGGSGNGNNVAVTADIPGGTGNTVTVNITGTLNTTATGYITNTATATPSEPGINPVVSQEVKTAVKPSGSPDIIQAFAGNPIIINVKNNDNNPASLTVYKNTNPANGTIVVNTDGSITYTSNQGFTGTDTFTYLLQSSEGILSDPITVTVTVTPSVVDAVSDSGNTVNGILGGVSLADVLANDTLNGVVVNSSDVTTTFVSSTNAGVTLSGTSVRVAAGTPGGNYTLTYRICEKLNPGNCDTADVTVFVMEPKISIIKTAVFTDENKDGYAKAGETITYSFEVKNTGNVALTNVTLADPLPGITITGGPIASLAALASATFTGTYTLTQADINLGSVSNQAEASGLAPDGYVVKDLSHGSDYLSDASTVVAIDGCTIEVFNGMSPDSGGGNDVFYIRGLECFPDNRVEIYNRWGVLVYERDHYDNVNGAFKGVSDGRTTISKSEELPVGTYYYVLKYKDNKGNGHQKAGYLYINRK